MAKIKDLTGKRFGKLTVIGFGGYSNYRKGETKWVCKCDCGNIVERSRKSLMEFSNSGCDSCKNIRKDLTGQRFGKLIVIKEAYHKNNKIYWECKCDCGNATIVSTSLLTSGKTSSCGCAKKKIDLTGKKFGRWTVLERSKTNNQCWKCRCECGVEKDVYQSALINGKSKSCGCYNKELVSIRAHKHGMSHDRIYNIYYNIKNRCNNPNDGRYKDYGGRGIKVCDDWENSFNSFYEWAIKNGYQNNLTIDRVDNNGDYCPENCRWATAEQQSNNKRKTVFLEFGGVKQSLKQWTDFMEWKYSKYYARTRRGKQTFKEEEIRQIEERLKKEGIICLAHQIVPSAQKYEFRNL